VETEVRSVVDRDQPYTMCEHSSVGAPFLEKGDAWASAMNPRQGVTFRMVLLPVDRRVKGVSDIRATPGGLAVDFMM
jgi:hypothetical protein